MYLEGRQPVACLLRIAGTGAAQGGTGNSAVFSWLSEPHCCLALTWSLWSPSQYWRGWRGWRGCSAGPPSLPACSTGGCAGGASPLPAQEKEGNVTWALCAINIVSGLGQRNHQTFHWDKRLVLNCLACWKILQEHDWPGSTPRPGEQMFGTSAEFRSAMELGVREVVEGTSLTSQRVLMVPLDRVAIILQLAGSAFKSSSTENISVIFTN